ncbi:hypothetical protein BY457_10466 [Marinilabilia salmonicolor]|jgi:hypothetical protein|nr:hypothetical protein BY457_10466 [Marinilabilia salmonicolor]
MPFKKEASLLRGTKWESFFFFKRIVPTTPMTDNSKDKKTGFRRKPVLLYAENNNFLSSTAYSLQTIL